MKSSKTNFVHKLQQLYRKAFLESGRQLPVKNGISRKEFLGKTSMAAASLMIPRFVNAAWNDENRTAENISVAIIGGGIAGLNACRILSKTPGFDVSLYEASERTGGRIYTAKNFLGEGLTTELGGEFIDTNHVDMRALIEEYKLETFDCIDDITTNNLPDHTFFFGGKRRTDQEIITEFKKIIPLLEADKAKLEDDAATAELDKMSLTVYLRKVKTASWFHDLIFWAFTAEYGLDASEQTCLNFIDLVGIGNNDEFLIFGNSDERFKIKGGNQSLTDAMAADLSSHIVLSSKLDYVDRQKGKINLRFKNGKTATADYLLIAIPFTALRTITVGPGIHFSEDKRRMIDELGYGTNSKLLLGFDKRLWRDQNSSGYIMNEEIQNGWDNSQLQNGNKGPAGFTIFLGGKKGKQLNASPAMRKKYLNQLEKIFPGAKAAHSNKYGLFNWGDHEFTGGSYSCYKIGQWSTFSTEEMLAPVDNVYFAGEHCSEMFQGFMNGGAETGRVAAESILAAVKKTAES